jgi:CelD/BcsL family acetyltransferase involved in cellulose biosynthesis
MPRKVACARVRGKRNSFPASLACSLPAEDGKIELMTSRVEIVPWEDSPALLEKWRECVTTSNNFRACLQMPEWVSYRWSSFSKMLLATLRDAQSGDLLAVTPVVENKYPLLFSIAGRELATIRVSGLLLNGNVPLFPHSDESYEALCQAALTMPSVDCLYMLGVPKTSPFWNFLTKAREAHPEWLVYTPNFESNRYLYVDMAMSYDEYVSKFKAKTRQTFRRKLRLLEREVGGRLDLIRVCSPDHVLQFLAGAHTIARRSWQQRLLDFDVDQVAGRQDLLEAMARRGVLRSYLLRSGEKALAYLVGFQLNGVFYFHETAFDEEYGHFSPGLALLYLIIKDCFEIDKPNIFHFGTGEMDYKTLLANRSGDEVTIMILRRSVANRAKVAVHRGFRKGVEWIKSRIARKVAIQEPS